VHGRKHEASVKEFLKYGMKVDPCVASLHAWVEAVKIYKGRDEYMVLAKEEKD